MKRLTFIAIACLLFTISSYSQTSQSIDDVLLYQMNDKDYKDKVFIYYNLLSYDGVQYFPPFPFNNGRVRDGKYKASATAMSNYIEEFKNNSGKKYKCVKFAKDAQGMPGVVFANENKDTLFVSGITVKEFFSAELLDSARERIGGHFYEKDMSPIPLEMNNPMYNPIFLVYSDAKTHQPKQSFLPFMSEWTIKDVNYDTTYYGEHNAINDGINFVYNRIFYVIENKKYGTLICNYNDRKHTFTKEEAIKPFLTPLRILEHYSEKDLNLLKEWAEAGTPDMKYVYYLVAQKKSTQEKTPISFVMDGSLLALYDISVTPLKYKDLDVQSTIQIADFAKKSCTPHDTEVLADKYRTIFHGIALIASSKLYDSKNKGEAKALYDVALELYTLANHLDNRSDAAEKFKETIKSLNEAYNRVMENVKN